MTALLRRVGLVIHPISEVYPDGAHEAVADPQWIRVCGERGWIAISGDKRLETVPENRQAIIEAKLRVFLLNDSNTLPEVWAAAVVLGSYRMAELISQNEGPFFVTISKRADGHVRRLRQPRGYTPSMSL